MNSDTKLHVKAGCVDFLVGEVETLRRQNDLLNAQMDIVNNFFNLVNRIGDKPSRGMGEDKLWQAKKEIREAKDELIHRTHKEVINKVVEK